MFAFHPEVEELFRLAGWYPARSVDCSPWTASLAREGYELFPAAERIIRSVGGLRVTGPGRPATAGYAREIEFDPIMGGTGEYDRFEDWQPLVGQRLYPLADLNPRLIVMVAEDGAIFAGMMDLFYRWGGGFEAAMERFFLGTRPPVQCLW